MPPADHPSLAFLPAVLCLVIGCLIHPLLVVGIFPPRDCKFIEGKASWLLCLCGAGSSTLDTHLLPSFIILPLIPVQKSDSSK